MKRTFLLSSLICAFAYLSPLAADVVLHYSFDTDYQDSSGNANHGVLQDSSNNGSAVLTAAAGVFGDGGMAQGDKNDRVNLTTPFTPANDTPWTIAFWCDLNGGAATYGFTAGTDNSVRARADSVNQLFLSINDEFYSFDSTGIITQNSKNNHIVIVAHPSGIDLDGVAGDDRLAVYVNGQLLNPKSGVDVTDASVSTAIEVENLGYSGRWPEGSDGDYDEFWILDEALDAHAVDTLYKKNYPGALWYVDASTPAAIEAQDGLTWDTAFADLQDALIAADDNAMIWVANGTYYPVTPVDLANPTEAEQAATFSLKAGQQLYGGFSGNETSLDDRSSGPGETKLSGDIGQDDGDVDISVGFTGKNSFNVVSVNAVEDCLLNGLVIVQGGGITKKGGGLSVIDATMVTIESCRFRENIGRDGGGVFLDSTASVIRDCEFESNIVEYHGGGLFVNSSSGEGSPELDVIDCVFVENQSGSLGGAVMTTYTDYTFERCQFIDNDSHHGGAARFYRSSGTILNTLFAENTATSTGGALRLEGGGSMFLQHVTFYGNTAVSDGHHIYTAGGSGHTMRNSVMWSGDSLPMSGDAFVNESAAVNYINSLVQGVDLTGVGVDNLDGTLAGSDPEFTEPSHDDFTVRAYSPLVNAGAEISGVEVGLAGTPRLTGVAVDIGCYEHEYPFEVTPLLAYNSTKIGDTYPAFDFIDALDSEDDALTFSSSDESVITVAHPMDDGEEMVEVGELTVVGLGTANVVFDFQYQDGAVHQFIQPVQVTVLPLDARDLSALVDVDYFLADFGVSQDYADLSAIFTDSPSSFSVLSADTDVFTVSQASGDVDIMPVGYGQAALTLRAHYSDGTVLEVVRIVSVNLTAGAQAAADAVDDQDFGINGDASSYAYADLSAFLAEGGSSIALSSSDEAVFTVSESGGVVTVTPLGVGSANITIELISSGGERYIIEKTLRVLDHDGHLLAQYLLDGDATDAQGQYDATASVEGIVWSVDDVVIAEAGVVEAPDTLSEDLFLLDDSFQLNMNFKIESAAEDGVKVLAGIQKNDSSATEDGGFMLLYVESAGLVNIYLSYTDGVHSDKYLFKQVATCFQGHLYSLQLVFDFDVGVWAVDIENQSTDDLFNQPVSGDINNKSEYDYDIEVFKEILRSNSLRFGAFYTRNTQDILEESEVRIDDVLVYSPAQAWYPVVNAALDALTDHVTNSLPLTEDVLDSHLATLEEQLTRTSFTKSKTSIEAFMQAYEAQYPPVFETDSIVSPSNLAIETQALLLVQQWIHNELFAPATLDEVSHYVFEAGEAYPGSVAATSPRVPSATVTADGNYATDPGALMIWADTVLRPLGYYVPAGEAVTISVDPAYTALGLEIVVGAHSRNLDENTKPSINRFRDITTEFELNQSTITVANAFGGGLYLRIPDGTSAGEIALTIEGAVKSAYFSTREGKETDVAAWLVEVANSEVPWVDFESDKFMFTVPLSFAQSVTQPDLVMERWDEIMDQYRYMNGRPLDNRIRAEYFLLDRMLVTPAWGAGYPLVVPISSASGQGSNWNPLNVLTVAPNRTLFHEFGHNCAIPGPATNPETRVLADLSVMELPSWAEGENLVNIPAFIVYNRVYGDSVVDAFSQATFQSLTIDQAAYDWMITENFRSNRPIGFDTSGVYDLNSNVAIDELRYQARGIGRYGDLVQLFGWEGLNLLHAEFYPIRLEDQVSPTGKQHRILRDAFIRRASEALQVNMSPLLHFWGIQPSASLQAELVTYPKSLAIKEKLEYYLSLAPETRSAFDSIITEISPGAGSYSEQRYDYYQGYVTDADAQSIGDQVEFILAEYGLDAAEVIFNLKLRQRPDGRVALQWTNDDQSVDHFVIRMKAAGAVVATELGTSDSTDFVTSMLADGAYTFSVAGVYADGTETLPRELSVTSLPTNESVAVLLNDEVFVDGSGFVGSGLSTEYLVGGTGGSGGTGGTGGLDLKQGSSLKVSAAAILDYIHYEAGDQSIGYEDVQLDSIVLVLPSAFESGPSVVEVWIDDTSTYEAYAGGINTVGSVRSFNLGEQELDITSMYSFEEDEDFYFFLFNTLQNNESAQQNAYLRVEFTVTGGYRNWYELAGLELGVDAGHGDDPDGDSVVNFVEFALGRDPAQAGEGATTQIGAGYDADELNIRFIRGEEAVRYQIEMTEDLSDWLDATVVWDSEVDFMTVVDPGEEQVVPVSIDGANSRFYRLSVQEDYEPDVLL